MRFRKQVGAQESCSDRVRLIEFCLPHGVEVERRDPECERKYECHQSQYGANLRTDYNLLLMGLPLTPSQADPKTAFKGEPGDDHRDSKDRYERDTVQQTVQSHKHSSRRRRLTGKNPKPL